MRFFLIFILCFTSSVSIINAKPIVDDPKSIWGKPFTALVDELHVNLKALYSLNFLSRIRASSDTYRAAIVVTLAEDISEKFPIDNSEGITEFDYLVQILKSQDISYLKALEKDIDSFYSLLQEPRSRYLKRTLSNEDILEAVNKLEKSISIIFNPVGENILKSCVGVL